MLSDFNCKIFNIDRFSLLTDEQDPELFSEKINSDMLLLDHLGFHRLFCQISHNENSPLSQTFLKADKLEHLIKLSVSRSIRRKFIINIVPSIHLSMDAPFIRNLSSLTALNSNYIFIDLPISVVYPEFLDGAINKILYNCKLRPIFNEFQDFASVYRDLPSVERIMKIKDSAFLFSLSSDSITKSIDVIKQIYNNGNTVLLCTASEHDTFNLSQISKNLKALKERLPRRIYLDIMLKAHSFLR